MKFRISIRSRLVVIHKDLGQVVAMKGRKITLQIIERPQFIRKEATKDHCIVVMREGVENKKLVLW
jgi:hypothetical protein